MESARSLEPSCHVLATREPDSPLWTFHFVNDDETAIESVELVAIKYEWGDQYVGGKSPAVAVADIEPGARVPICQDDGSSETRVDLWLRVTHRGLETWLLFEF